MSDNSDKNTQPVVDRKKVLFVSYYFPPGGNSGGYRVHRLARFLQRCGWNPAVLTVKNAFGQRPPFDFDLAKSFEGPVYRSGIFYPFKKGNQSLLKKLTRRVWSEITFPDDKVTWVITASIKAIQILKREKIKCVFITGQPFSSFLIGLILKVTTRVTVCLDYRDPWTGSDYYVKRKWKHYLCKILERIILAKVDRVYCVTPAMTEFLKCNALPPAHAHKLRTLTYSYSPEDYDAGDEGIAPRQKFTLTFAGSSFGVADPEPLLKATLKLRDSRPEIYRSLQIIVIGNLLDGWQDWLEGNELWEKVEVLDYMPFRKVLAYFRASHGLLLPYSEHEHMRICMPVKIFDYLALQKPILFYGPPGQIWDVLGETGTGYCRLPSDVTGIAEDISSIYLEHYIRGKVLKPTINRVNAYSTDAVGKGFLADLETLVQNNV